MSVPLLEDIVLLRPSDLEPLRPDYEVLGVFNPAAARYGGEILLLVRVAERPRHNPPGQLVSPRAELGPGAAAWVVDTFEPAGARTDDPRIFWLPDGRVRLRYVSHLRLVRLSPDGRRVHQVQALPDLLPQQPWEECGLEDPRLAQIGDTYYITYVAISRQMGVATALMTTRDFQTFERRGIIFPTENKDVVLLPEKWNGYFVAYHRPVSHHWLDAPSVETALSPDAAFWGRHQLLFGPRPGTWDSVKVGAGAPPLRLPQGWLLIYHGVAPATADSPVGRYCAGAVLLRADDPRQVIARSSDPLLCPERPSERQGFAPHVLFPSGALLDRERRELLLFNGAADQVVTLYRLSLPSILAHLGVGSG